MGYTTLMPVKRMESLSEQCAQQARDIGAFRLVHAVPVSKSYDMEQMLFHALVSRRIDVRKEFFFGSADGLAAALDAARAADSAGSISPLLEYLQTADLGEEAVQFERPTLSSSPTPRDSQFVAICRNRYHEASIYRLIGGARLARIVANLNDRQREFTSQLGEYDVVHIQPVLDSKLILQDFRIRNAALCVRPGRDHYRGPLHTLSSLLAERVAIVDRAPSEVKKPSPADAAEQDALHDEVALPPLSCEVVRGPISASWAPWTIACLCGSHLRVLAAIGARGKIECPACRRTRACRQGAGALSCLGPWVGALSSQE